MKLTKAIGARKRRVTRKVAGVMKAGARKLKKAERSGALAKWKTRVGLGIQALEFAALATAAVKGARIGKRPARPAKRRRTR
jgi:hypothetical protein